MANNWTYNAVNFGQDASASQSFGAYSTASGAMGGQCIFKDKVIISKWKCGSLLGSGGKTVKAIQTLTNTKILVDQNHDTAICHVSGPNWTSVQFARRIMQDIGNKQFKGFSVIRDFAEVHECLQKQQKLSREVPQALYVAARGFILYSQIVQEYHQIKQQNGVAAAAEYLRGKWHSMSATVFVYTTQSGFVECQSEKILPYIVEGQYMSQSDNVNNNPDDNTGTIKQVYQQRYHDEQTIQKLNALQALLTLEMLQNQKPNQMYKNSYGTRPDVQKNFGPATNTTDNNNSTGYTTPTKSFKYQKLPPSANSEVTKVCPPASDTDGAILDAYCYEIETKLRIQNALEKFLGQEIDYQKLLNLTNN
eukprot:TRINITY_DN59162_c2_g1_i1.p1 TRINITY_DN59162_c2_g1~~TRINITY_DN59162_c2_g1_i1.p1  ORF type:complete len:364 (+),score=27.95 TRINITY_DN59162_c2_g1_i1:186-1277(+)